jgi:hypothetical protein
VHHLDSLSLYSLGEWLQRKWNAMNKKKTQSRSELGKLGIPEVDLRAEWKEQVKQQTKPLACTSLLNKFAFVSLFCYNSFRPIKKSCTKGS